MYSKDNMTLAEITRICTVTYAKSLRACSISQGRLVETFLETRDLALLLEEEEVAFTDDDTKALQAAVDDLKKQVDNLKKLNDGPLGGKMKGSVAEVEGLLGEIPDVSSIAAIADKGDGEKLKEELEGLNEPINKVGEAIATFLNSLTEVAKDLSANVKGVTDDDMEKTIRELSEMAENGELKTKDGKEIELPGSDKVTKMVADKVETPKWFSTSLKAGMDAAKADSGGFFGKAVAFMKGLFGGGGGDKALNPDTFSTGFIELTLKEVAEGAKAAEQMSSMMQDSVESSAEATGAAQASAAAEASDGEGGDELPDSAKKAEKRPDFDISDLIKLLAITNAGAAKSLEGLPEEEQEAAMADDIEAIQGGEVSPEEALDGVAEEAEEAADAPKWSEISKDFLDDLGDESKPDGEELVGNLKDDEDWAQKVGAAINMSERFVPSRLPMSILLQEDVAFDDILTAASSVVDDEAKAKKSAITLAQSIVDAGVEVSDVPSEDEDGEAPEAKEVEAALDELEPGLTSYIDDNQDIIAKALADLLKGNEEIAAKVAELLASDESERSGEAEEVADLADDAGVSQEDIDAAIEQGIEDATDDLADEIGSEVGDGREEALTNYQAAEEADDEDLSAKIEEIMSEIAGDLGIEVSALKDALEDDEKMTELFMELDDTKIDELVEAIENLTELLEKANEEAGVASEGESDAGEMTPEEKEAAIEAIKDTTEKWQEAKDDDDDSKQEAAEEIIAAVAEEQGIDTDTLISIIEDPEENLEDAVKENELEIEKLQGAVEELANEIANMLSREIEDEPGNLTDDEKDELEALLKPISDDYEEVEAEDSEEAEGVIEDPAQELGVKPDELGDALEDIDALDALVSDKELKFSDVKDQLVSAQDNLEGGAEGEEDDPAEVEKIVKAAEDAAADPDDSEEAVEDAITKAIDDWEGQLSDRQQKRIQSKGRLDQLKQAVADATPPQVDPPADPEEVHKAGEDWGKQHKIDDPKSALGNPKNFSPKQMKKLIDLFPDITQAVQGDAEEGEEEVSGKLSDDNKEELEKELGALKPDLEAAEKEDEEATEETLEKPAQELGVKPDEFKDALEDIESMQDMIADKELKFADVMDQIKDTEEQLSDEGEEGSAQGDKEEAETDKEAEAASAAAEKEAESKGLSPAAGSEEIIAKWAESGKTLSKNVSKKQREKLKGVISPILDAAADKLKAEVEKSVDDWRGAQKVLQKPNVSDKQINTLKQSLGDFISTVVRSESRDPRQAKASLVEKITKFLTSQAGFTRVEIRTMDQKALLENFVHSYCNIQTHSLNRRGMLVEVLHTRTSFKTSYTEESTADRWTRLAGLS